MRWATAACQGSVRGNALGRGVMNVEPSMGAVPAPGRHTEALLAEFRLAGDDTDEGNT